MKFIRNREELEQELVLMHRDGCPIRELSRRFEISRNAVRRILRAHKKRRDQGHDRLKARPAGVKRKSLLDDFSEKIEELLKKFPKISGLRIYEELQTAGYSGGITILRDNLRTRRKSEREPQIRFETAPGLQGQVDWSPYKVKFLRTGKATVQCFSYILGYSRRQFIEFTLDRKFCNMVRRHQDAFSHYQGVPAECLYDGEKTVILRWEAGKPVFNPAFTLFITHYNCRPIACRPRRPQTKGKVEAPFQYVEGNLLGGREFQDLEDLKATARWWLAEKSDRHIHDTTRRPPIELFMEEEQSRLQPIPLHPYDTSEVALLVCRPEGLVLFETNWYSVPSEYIADILSLKATEREILIYSPELKLVARHERYPVGKGLKSEDPNHHSPKKSRYGLESVREGFLGLGEAAEVFLKGLTDKQPKNCGFHARYILHLKENYLSEDIHRALEHALRYHAFDGKAIERILMAQAKTRTLESVRNERAKEELAQTLPKIMQRPLAEYSALFEKGERTDECNDGREQSDQDKRVSDGPETDDLAAGF
jgi:transposase